MDKKPWPIPLFADELKNGSGILAPEVVVTGEGEN